jgi:hypothetical protein
VRWFLEREFKKEPVIVAILRLNPPLLTSNHEPFLVMAAAREKREPGGSSPLAGFRFFRLAVCRIDEQQ